MDIFQQCPCLNREFSSTACDGGDDNDSGRYARFAARLGLVRFNRKCPFYSIPVANGNDRQSERPPASRPLSVNTPLVDN